MRKLRSKFRWIASIDYPTYTQGAGGEPVVTWNQLIPVMRIAREDYKSLEKYENGIFSEYDYKKFWFRNPGEGIEIKIGNRLTFRDDHAGRDRIYVIESVHVPNKPKYEDWYVIGKEEVPKDCT